MDLFKEWDSVSDEKYSEKLLCWIDQKGFPLVTVKSCEVGDNEAVVKLGQNIYLESGEEGDSTIKWFIPIWVLTDAGEQFISMSEKEQTFKVKVKSKDSFVKLNSRGKSFIRVK